MISVLMILSSRGDVLLSRSFRAGHSVQTLADTFRRELISTKKFNRSSVNIIDNLCYVHLTLSELYIVMVSSSNVDCVLCIQYGIQLLQAIVGYYKKVDEATLKKNFEVLQEIVDETMDFGYPLLTDKATLALFIPEKGIRSDVLKNPKVAEHVTRKYTGPVPWREDGFTYRINELFVDIFEDVNLLLSATGEILRSNVAGRIVIKSFLSGVPSCKLVLNANVYGEGFSEPREENQVILSDVSFHRCVQLNKLSSEQGVCFIPPNDDFTLMHYRSGVGIHPPLKVSSLLTRELSKTRLQIEFDLQAEMVADLTTFTDIVVRIPCPDNIAAVQVNVERGQAQFRAVNKAVIWELPVMNAGEKSAFSGEMVQLASTVEAVERLWSKPPISIAFQCVSYTLTGLKVVELKVEEPHLRYTPNKWIRYTTQAGKYQCRI